MSIQCTYSYKEWSEILKLLYRVKESKTTSVISLYGIKKVIAREDTNDIGQTGNSIQSIDSALSNIRHKLGQNSEIVHITISLETNIYHLIKRVRRRNKKPKRFTSKMFKHKYHPPL